MLKGWQKWCWSVAITVLGAALIVVGARSSDPYVASVLAGLGTTVFLTIPILLVQQVVTKAQKVTDAHVRDVETSLAEVRTTVGEVSDRLAEVAARTADRVDRRRERDEAHLLAPARAITEDASFSAVRDAMQAAAEAKAISRWQTIGGGVRATVSMSFGALGFRSTVGWSPRSTPRGQELPEVLSVTVAPAALPSPAPQELIRSPAAASLRWQPEWSVEQCFEELDARLRAKFGRQAPEVAPEVLLGRLQSALELAFRERTARGASTSWSLIGVITDRWFLSSDGLQGADLGVVFSTKNLMVPSGEPPYIPVGADPEELAYVWLEAKHFLDKGASSLLR